MNGIVGKSKFNFLRILLYSEPRSSIILDKHIQELRNKITNTIHWSKQGGVFNTTYTSKVYIVLPELYAMKNVT